MTELEIQLLHACRSALKLLQFCGLDVIHNGTPRAEAVLLRKAIETAEKTIKERKESS